MEWHCPSASSSMTLGQASLRNRVDHQMAPDASTGRFPQTGQRCKARRVTNMAVATFEIHGLPQVAELCALDHGTQSGVWVRLDPCHVAHHDNRRCDRGPRGRIL
jgi:hypothetical protein